MATRLPALCCPPVTGTTTTTSPSGICCPPPGQSMHPKPIPVTPPDPCADAQPVTICGGSSPIPVEPVCSPLSIPYEKCDGTTGTAVGTTCDLVQVVPHPDAVMKVKICETTDRELVKMCDPVTGEEVLIQYDVTTVPPTVLAATNLSTNTPYTGSFDDLVKCGTAEVEQEVYCDGTNTFIRWYVVDAQGQPTGAYWDTDLEGQAYTVPTGATLTRGECPVPCADVPIQSCSGKTIGYAYSESFASIVGATVPLTDCDGNVYGYIMAARDEKHTVAIEQGCTTPTIVGYAAATGCVKCCKDTEVVEMCENGNSFLRHFVYQDGEFQYKYDTKLDGTTYTVIDEADVHLGACEAPECDSTISSAFADDLTELLPGTSISIQKPDCCMIKVNTNVGSFIVASKVSGYSTSDFKCEVTVTDVEILKGSCTLSDVIVTTQKSLKF